MIRDAQPLITPRSIAMAAVCVIGVIIAAYALEVVHMIGVANADTGTVIVQPPPATGGLSIMELIVLGIAALGGLVKILEVVIVGLKWLSPRTETKVDDTALSALEGFHDRLDAVEQALIKLTTTTTPIGQPVSPTKTPQSGRIRFDTVILMAIAALIALPLVGCATLRNAPSAAKDAIVDCTKADAAAIGVLVGELGADAVTTALGTGQADWSKLEADAIAQGKVIGGCALAQFVAALSKASVTAPARQSFVAVSTPLDDGRAALERFRAKVGGGQWKTDAGVM